MFPLETLCVCVYLCVCVCYQTICSQCLDSQLYTSSPLAHWYRLNHAWLLSSSLLLPWSYMDCDISRFMCRFALSCWSFWISIHISIHIMISCAVIFWYLVILAVIPVSDHWNHSSHVCFFSLNYVFWYHLNYTWFMLSFLCSLWHV